MYSFEPLLLIETLEDGNIYVALSYSKLNYTFSKPKIIMSSQLIIGDKSLKKNNSQSSIIVIHLCSVGFIIRLDDGVIYSFLKCLRTKHQIIKTHYTILFSMDRRETTGKRKLSQYRSASKQCLSVLGWFFPFFFPSGIGSFKCSYSTFAISAGIFNENVIPASL